MRLFILESVGTYSGDPRIGDGWSFRLKMGRVGVVVGVVVVVVEVGVRSGSRKLLSRAPLSCLSGVKVRT